MAKIFFFLTNLISNFMVIASNIFIFNSEYVESNFLSKRWEKGINHN